MSKAEKHAYDGACCNCHGHGCHEHNHTVHERAHGDGCSCGHDHEAPKSWYLPLVCGGLFVLGLFLPLLPIPDWVQGIWMGAVAIPPFVPVVRNVGRELRRFSMGEHFLLALAAIGAFAIGEWVEGALVVLLFDLGERLEGSATAFSRRSIAALAAVTPDTAFRLTAEGDAQEIPASAVCKGDCLYIPPHSRIPVDCRVLTGQSAVDCSSLTGESEPVFAGEGDTLFSGSLNGSGMLTAQALRSSDSSAAARILQLVEGAVARKGRSERFIGRFARVYTPAVTGLAVLVAIIPPFLGGNWLTCLYRALAFLVASCPCALVISVPLGFYAGVAAAARQGVLVKGGIYVEKLAAVKAVAFDKTGTLTTEELTLTETVFLATFDEDPLPLAAALEQYSHHPVGRALCRAAGDGSLPSLTGVEELSGMGVTALRGSHKVACGNRRLLAHLMVDTKALPDAETFLCVDNQPIAAFRFAATLREGAECVGEELHSLGVQRLVLLSGDRQSAAEAVGKAVNMSAEVHGDLLPEDKLVGVRELQQEGFVTAFVGDGINDAPVLAAADVGVAMGLGSQAAIETADAVLVSGGLSRLPTAIRLCRRVVRTVRGNMVFALAVKAAVLVLAVLGFAPMWLAVFADVGVTLLTVAHTLTLLLPG